jgi:glycosyltransferase involved in cell wall biosynthesis
VTERDVVAIMACYNTRERTRAALARYRSAAPCDLVVVDDGSDDGTAKPIPFVQGRMPAPRSATA